MSTSGFLETLTSIFAFLQSDNRPWRGGVIQSVGNIMKAEIGSPRFSLFNSNGSSNRKRQVNRDPHAMRITMTQVNIIMSLILSISMIITYTGCLPQGGGGVEGESAHLPSPKFKRHIPLRIHSFC